MIHTTNGIIRKAYLYVVDWQSSGLEVDNEG